MNYEGRGIKIPKFWANEMLRYEDLTLFQTMSYGNTCDFLESLLGTFSNNIIFKGLYLSHYSGMTIKVSPGMAVSPSGRYLNNDLWGFSSGSGIFLCVNPTEVTLAFDVGGVLDRIDTVIIRPIRVDYDAKNRLFKDPVTKIVTSSLANVKHSIECEFQIIKGTEGSGVAPNSISGWIKIAEIFVGAGLSAITQSDIKNVVNDLAGTVNDWTTEVSATSKVNTIIKNHTDIQELKKSVIEYDDYINGLKLSNNSVDGDNDVDISSGVCLDSGNDYLMRLTSGLTKRLDAAWAQGNNNGGLFSGSKQADTWYNVFLISNGTNVDVGFDTSDIAANRPSGWNYYRRIGWVRTDASSNILRFKWYGKGSLIKVLWDKVIIDIDAVAIPTSDTLYTFTVPKFSRVIGILNPGYGTNGYCISISMQTPDITLQIPVGINGNSVPASANRGTAVGGTVSTAYIDATWISLDDWYTDSQSRLNLRRVNTYAGAIGQTTFQTRGYEFER